MLVEYPCAMQRRTTYRRREGNVYKCAVAVALVFHIYTDILSAAPASYESLLPSQPSEIAEYYSDITGCYYNFQRYEEGDRIVTNEPCLNCTCHNRMLMCYLRVCPFTKAIGQDCTIEKKPDQCCPVITCPEVPVKLLTSSTTSSPTPTTPTTEIGFHDNYGCTIHNSFYADGAQVPSDPRKPCELCYCIRNRTACVMQECTLHVEGCKPVYQDGVCCPVRYDCDYEKDSTSTPHSQTNNTVIKATTYPSVVDCQFGNQSYSDGELITTDKPCEHCYCMRGDIVCAVQDCGEPLRGKDCVPTMPPPERCCPSSYDCTNDTQSTEGITKSPETYSTAFATKFSTVESSTRNRDRTPVVLTQEQMYQMLGESETNKSTSTPVPANNVSQKLPAKHPSEDILLDANNIDAGEHFSTTARQKDRPSSPQSLVTEKLTTAEEIHTTEKQSYGDYDAASKQPLPLSTLEPNVPTTTASATLNTEPVTVENVQTTLSVAGDRLSSPVQPVHDGPAAATDAPTAEYPTTKSPFETTKFDSNEIGEKVTEAIYHENPTTIGQVISDDKATEKPYETTAYAGPSLTTLESRPAANDQAQNEQSSEPNRYASTTREFDRTTTAVKVDESSTEYVEEHVTTAKPSSEQNEDATENINTVSEKITEPLVNQTSVSSKLPESTAAETTVKYSPTETAKPDSLSEKFGGTTEAAEIATALGIPGEGSCLVDGITYPNTSVIESSNPCHSKCICLSSIPTCTLVTCNPPPSDPKCMPIQLKPESCCPVYVCNGDEQLQPVIPSHNQVASDEPSHDIDVTTEAVSQPSSSSLPDSSLSETNEIENAPDNGTPSPNIHDQETSSSSEDGTPEATELSSHSHYPVPATEVPIATEAPADETPKPLGDQNAIDNEVHEATTVPPLASAETTIFSRTNFSDSVSDSSSPPPRYTTIIASTSNDKTEIPTESDEAQIGDKPTTVAAAQTPSNYVTVSSLPVTVKDETTEDEAVETTTAPAPAENNEIAAATAESQDEKVGSTRAPLIPTKIVAVAEESSEAQPTEHVGVTSQSVTWDDSSHHEEHIDQTQTTVPASSLAPQEPHDETETTTASYSYSSSSSNEVTGTEQATYESTGNPAAGVDQPNTVIPEAELQPIKTDNPESGSYVTTLKPEEVEVAETTVGAVSDYSESSTAASSEVPQTFGPVEKIVNASTPASWYPTTVITEQPSKGPEHVPVDHTEYEASVPTTAAPVSETTIADSQNENETHWPSEEGTPTKGAEESSSPPAPTEALEQSNEIGSTDANESPADKLTTVFEHSSEHSSLPSSEPSTVTENIYISEVPLNASSSPSPSSAEYPDVNTTLPPVTAAAEVSPEVTTLPPTAAPAHEEVYTTKAAETHDVPTTQPSSTAAGPVSVVTPESQPDLFATTVEVRFPNATEKQQVAAGNTSAGTSTESGYSPIQQSTWTRKPIDEEVTSEPNYYPHPPLYPTGGGTDNNGVNPAGPDGSAPIDEYDEDSNSFGPGTCRYGGKMYVSAQQIPRDDPCDFCFCFRSDIICLQQSCPPPIHGCRQEPIQGFCCPRYECPVARDISLNATTTTSTTTTTTTTTTALPSRPPRFPLDSYRPVRKPTGCVIHGYFYDVGENIAIASGPCLECICGSDGRMKCDPKSCSPEPYVRQMMAKATFRR